MSWSNNTMEQVLLPCMKELARLTYNAKKGGGPHGLNFKYSSHTLELAYFSPVKNQNCIKNLM